MKYNVEIIPRLLHFKQPAGTSRGYYTTRNVWYIVIRDPMNAGHIGIGECAPLPDLSCDAVPGYVDILNEFCSRFSNNGIIDYEEMRNYPSMLFGLETALKHYNAQSLAFYDTPFSRGECGIYINGLIWMGDYDTMLSRIEDKIKDGYKCIKLKIGAIDFGRELSLISYIRSAFSSNQIELRVDANGAFGADEALYKLEKLAAFDIHSIEQPIKAGQWKKLAFVVRNSPIRVALDEELIGINDIEGRQRLLDSVMPDYIILKPTLHGSFYGCEQWIAEAGKRNIGWWITSAIESNVCLNAIAQWTATFNVSIPHGLGTGLLFTDNIDMPLKIMDNALWFDANGSDRNIIDYIWS